MAVVVRLGGPLNASLGISCGHGGVRNDRTLRIADRSRNTARSANTLRAGDTGNHQQACNKNTQ
jgi:hypothetical protein